MVSQYLGSAIPNVVIDLLILILPVPLIWRLRTSLLRKMGITIVFLLGYSSIVVSIGRLVAIVQLQAELEKDITYEGIPLFFWIFIAGPALILSICLPSMLSLSKWLGMHYFQPLASMVSTIFAVRSIQSLRQHPSNDIINHTRHPRRSSQSHPSTRGGNEDITRGNAGTELFDLHQSSEGRRQNFYGPLGKNSSNQSIGT
ncbi:hypothetical protein GGS20DRAFT_208214 [Poronia punctata]|nr:hypothetical protein GGS20DRAFT_208214 [Poronia punctata]